MKNIFRTMLLLLTLATSAFGQTVNTSSQPGPTFDAQVTQAVAALGGNGVVVADPTTPQSFTACPTWGSNKIILELHPVQYTFLTNCTIPSNITLKFWNGAVFAPNSVNVFINGNVDAAPEQKLVNISSGNVVFQHVPIVWWDWYGAGQGTTLDSTPGFNAGIKAYSLIVGNQMRPPFDCVPGTLYTVRVPVHVNVTNLSVGGPLSGSRSCGLQSGFGSGPQMVIGPGPSQTYCGNGAFTCPQSAPLVPGLTTSGGNALQFDGVHPYWFNLSLDTKEFNGVNGQGQITLEAMVTPTAIKTGVIMGSSGSISSTVGVTQAFQLLFIGDVPTCIINTNNGKVRIGGGHVTAGTTYHIACSKDDSTLRLFVAGVETASSPAVGTLIQGNEDVTVGPALQTWPDTGVMTNACQCVVDSVKISDNAVYVDDSGFAPPTAKLVKDSHTMGLLNFGNCFDVFCDFQSKDSPGYLFFRNATFVGAIDHVDLHDMMFTTGEGIGGGLIWYQTTTWSEKNISIFTNTGYSNAFWNNTYFGSMSDVEIVNGGTGTAATGHGIIGLAMIGAVGLIPMNNVHVTGGLYSFVGNGGSISSSMLICNPNVETKECFVFKGGGGAERVDVNHITCDTEIGTTNNFQACLHLINIRGTFEGGEPEGFATAPIVIDGGDSYTFIGTRFLNDSLLGYSGPVIHVVKPPTQPVHLINPVQAKPYAAWCDDTPSCVIQ